tara:strand:+ start:387 stop:734 length:348 start_codon:yes stop_codon:yes gene_type:complete
LGALYYIIIFLFVLICLSLIGIILLQSSKTGGMGAGIAGNSALNSAFGSQGADKLLVKITTVLASLFMLLSITLNILSSPNDGESTISNKSVIQGNIENNTAEPDISTPIDTTTR